MSTTSTVPEVSSGLSYVTENVTSGRLQYVASIDADTGVKTFKAVAVSENDVQEATESGLYDGKEVAEATLQTFSKYKVNTINGALELMPEEEVVNMINSGISVKQGNAIRSLLLGKDKKTGEFDFEFTETPYDLRNVLAEVTNKRLTPTEKLTRDLSEGLENVPVEMLDKFMALLEARKAQVLGQGQ